MTELSPCYRHAGVFARATGPGGGHDFEWCLAIAEECPDCEVFR